MEQHRELHRGHGVLNMTSFVKIWHNGPDKVNKHLNWSM